VSAGPVVVAYDGTDEARGALLWALHQAAGDQQVLPVAVLGHEPSPLPLFDRIVPAPDETDRVARRIAGAWNEDGADLADVAPLRFVRGHPAPALAALADDVGAELIVMGHHRGRRLEGVRASVARDLIRVAPCPVVVVS
jgi:nucleotide-binding universal stress UspA family protein